jgi:hypothetical protein
MTEIKIRRLEWLGYVIRKKISIFQKMILNSMLKERSAAGRPNFRWLDDVVATIRNLVFLKRD